MKDKPNNWLFTVLDVIYVLGLALYFIYQSGVDPGDIIFLYVLENVYMVFGLMAFMVIAIPILRILRINSLKRKGKKVFGSDKLSFFKFMLQLLIGSAVVIAVGGIVLVLLNQISINLVLEYFTANGYYFDSMAILSKDFLFFEKEIAVPMMDLLKLNHKGLLLIIGGRYFLELLIAYISNLRFARLDRYGFLMYAPVNVAIHAILGPVLVLLCMLVMAVLTLIFGNQAWIVIGAVISFRVLFNLIYWYLSKQMSWAMSN